MDINLKLIIYQIINFLVLMGVMTFLFNKFIRPFMTKRSDDIAAAFQKIDEQRKEVDNLHLSVTQELQEIRQKSRTEIDKAILEGSRIRDDIHKAAQKEAAELLQKARVEIELEKQKAIATLENEVANLTMAVTQKLIGTCVDDKIDRQLVGRFLNDVTSVKERS